MLRKRLLILLGGCFLVASAAWADDVGYVNCSSHPEDTQVFGKPRKTPDTVASLACGERFTVLIYGFIFSRIETRDGKIGYIFSSLITVDKSAASVLQPASERVPVPRSNVPQTTAKAVKANPATATQPQPAAVQPTPVQVAPAASAVAPAATSNVAVTTEAVAQANPTMSAQPEPAAAQPTPVQVAPAASVSAAAPVATLDVPVATATVVQSNSVSSTQPQATPAQVVAAAPAPSPEPAPTVPETVASAAQPSPAAPAQPQPTAAQPEPAPIRDTSVRTSWEKPLPGARRTSLVELFGGYAFARLQNGGTGTNLSGALGAFGWNIKPWLQLVADTSYSVVTVSGTKNVLYGNHFGPRYFHRGRNRWGVTPFVEGLVGGSRADTTVSGAGGYKTSVNCFSIKAGGGLDIHPSRHIDIRLFDVDYYRTSFGTNVHQNNYWASTGIVLRLFGGQAE